MITRYPHCLACDSATRTYPEHELVQTLAGEKILGYPDQLCEGLFHVPPFPEIESKTHWCISGENEDTCRMNHMTLVVMTNKRFVARYTGCQKSHAEIVFLQSESFREHLRDAQPTSVHLFMKMHPCHIARGSQSKLFARSPESTRPCSDLMVQFYNQYFKPHNIELTIHISTLFKTVGAAASSASKRQGIEGLLVLIRAGIHVRCFEQHHWLLLANLCKKPIRLQHLLSKERIRMDEFIRTFLRDYTS